MNRLKVVGIIFVVIAFALIFIFGQSPAKNQRRKVFWNYLPDYMKELNSELPTPEQVFPDQQQSSVVYDANGKELYKIIKEENETFHEVKFEQGSKFIKFKHGQFLGVAKSDLKLNAGEECNTSIGSMYGFITFSDSYITLIRKNCGRGGTTWEFENPTSMSFTDLEGGIWEVKYGSIKQNSLIDADFAIMAGLKTDNKDGTLEFETQYIKGSELESYIGEYKTIIESLEYSL